MPKQRFQIVPSVYVMLMKDGQIILARRYNTGYCDGEYSFPAGHLEGNETSTAALLREVKEEIGVDINIKEKLGENEYVASHPEHGKMRKRVTYFLAEAVYQPLKLEDGKGGLDDAQWFKITDILDLALYDDMIPIFTKAVNALLNKQPVSQQAS